jgi:hypothetical protein
VTSVNQPRLLSIHDAGVVAFAQDDKFIENTRVHRELMTVLTARNSTSTVSDAMWLRTEKYRHTIAAVFPLLVHPGCTCAVAADQPLLTCPGWICLLEYGLCYLTARVWVLRG